MAATQGAMPDHIHLATVESGTVRPLCGSFKEGLNWTTARRAVTCPRCLAQLRAAPPEAEEEERRPVRDGSAARSRA